MTRRHSEATPLLIREHPITDEETHREAIDPRFGIALLRVALGMKRTPGATLELVLARVSREMHLDEDTFRRFLARNTGLLRALGSARPSTLRRAGAAGAGG